MGGTPSRNDRLSADGRTNQTTNTEDQQQREDEHYHGGDWDAQHAERAEGEISEECADRDRSPTPDAYSGSDELGGGGRDGAGAVPNDNQSLVTDSELEGHTGATCTRCGANAPPVAGCEAEEDLQCRFHPGQLSEIHENSTFMGYSSCEDRWSCCRLVIPSAPTYPEGFVEEATFRSGCEPHPTLRHVFPENRVKSASKLG
jgi:hypothetical protein